MPTSITRFTDHFQHTYSDVILDKQSCLYTQYSQILEDSGLGRAGPGWAGPSRARRRQAGRGWTRLDKAGQGCKAARLSGWQAARPPGRQVARPPRLPARLHPWRPGSLAMTVVGRHGKVDRGAPFDLHADLPPSRGSLQTFTLTQVYVAAGSLSAEVRRNWDYQGNYTSRVDYLHRIGNGVLLNA